MANEILQKPDTQINWGSVGGEDHVMTLLNMANGAGREGDEHDFGAVHATRWRVYYHTELAVGPTFGAPIEIYMAYSHDAAIYDGEHSGADGVMASAEQLPNMQLIHVHSCLNNVVDQWSGGIFHLQTRYGAPLVYNNSGQAFENAAADHELIFEPIIDEIQ